MPLPTNLPKRALSGYSDCSSARESINLKVPPMNRVMAFKCPLNICFSMAGYCVEGVPPSVVADGLLPSSVVCTAGASAGVTAQAVCVAHAVRPHAPARHPFTCLTVQVFDRTRFMKYDVSSRYMKR